MTEMLATVGSSNDLARDAKRILRAMLPNAFLNWRDARFYARYGEVELHILEYLCSRDRDSIDVGANEGCYVNVLRKFSRRVLAFEPIPWLAEKIAARFGADVEVFQVALSSAHSTAVLRVPVVKGIDIEGCATINDKAATHYSGCKEIVVRADRLDDLYGGDAGFIKIDVEGHEEAVLAGARGTIARSRPRVLVEVVDYLAPGGVGRIAGYFRALDFEGHFIYRREVVPIEQFDARVMQAEANAPDLTAPLAERERFGAFVYNFLFLPREESAALLERIAARIHGL